MNKNSFEQDFFLLSCVLTDAPVNHSRLNGFLFAARSFKEHQTFAKKTRISNWNSFGNNYVIHTLS